MRYLFLTFLLVFAAPCFGDTYSVTVSATYAGNDVCGPSGNAVCVESFTASFIITSALVETGGGFVNFDTAIFSPTIQSIGPLGQLTCCYDGYSSDESGYIAIFGPGVGSGVEFDIFPFLIPGTYAGGGYGQLYRCITQPCVAGFSPSDEQCYNCPVSAVFQTITIAETSEPPTFLLVFVGMFIASIYAWRKPRSAVPSRYETRTGS